MAGPPDQGDPCQTCPAAPADLLRSLTRAERLLSRRLGAVLADDGLTIEAWRVLCLLADGQGHPMSEVSAEASLPPGTLTKLVDQLVDRNLVFRRIDPLDRRRIRAYLTARGRREHDRLDERVRASLAELRRPGGHRPDRAARHLIARLDPARRRDPAEATSATPLIGAAPTGLRWRSCTDRTCTIRTRTRRTRTRSTCTDGSPWRWASRASARARRCPVGTTPRSALGCQVTRERYTCES